MVVVLCQKVTSATGYCPVQITIEVKIPGRISHKLYGYEMQNEKKSNILNYHGASYWPDSFSCSTGWFM